MSASARRWRGSPSKRLSLAIALFACAVLALLWGATFYESRHDRNVALAQARKDTANLVLAFGEHIDRMLTAIDQVMLAIKSEYSSDPDRYRLPNWLKDSPFLAGLVRYVSIVGPDGVLQQTDKGPPDHRIDLSDRPHFRYQLNPSAPQPYISAPVIGRESGKWSVQISRRLERADGSFAGVLVVTMDPAYLSAFYDSIYLGKQGVVVVVGRDGIIRARCSTANDQIGQNITGRPLFEAAAKSDSGTLAIHSEIDHLDRIYSFAAIPDYPLVVAVGKGLQEVLAEPARRQAARVLSAGGVSVVLLVLTGLLLREVARSRQREIEVGEKASLLTAIIDVNPSAIWVKDEQGRFEIINDATATVIGRPKGEILGRRSADVLPSADAQEIAGWDDEAVVRDGVTVAGERSFTCDGELHHLLTFRRSCVVGGRSLVVGSAVDITPLRRAEEELRCQMQQREAAEAGLHQAQKMEAIGNLTGGIAHDFNNLLTSVLGNIELALRRVRDGPTVQLLRNAERAAQRGAVLIQRLLAFARKQRLQARAIDLNRLVLGMRELLDCTIGSVIKIETELEEGLWPALADANQVEAAVLNITINARDAMPAGGRILIRTANIQAGASELPPELPPSDYVSITVTDVGAGMDPDVLAKAFDPFFTTKEVGRGSGLGLSQVYGMARQSGGTATISSTPGKGTSVRLYLPRAVEQAREPVEIPAPAGS